MNCERKRVLCLVYSVILLTLLLALFACSKEAKIERHWKKGEQYFLKNKPQEALLEYKNVLQLNPRHAKAHYKVGLIYLSMKMFREAYAEVSKAIELDPEMIDARNQIGQLYLLSGDRKKAREQAEVPCFIISNVFVLNSPSPTSKQSNKQKNQRNPNQETKIVLAPIVVHFIHLHI